MRFFTFMNSRTGRVIRALMGITVLAAGAVVGGGLGIGLMVFSVLPLGTAMFGVCPLNPLVGLPVRACAVAPARPKRG